LKRKFFSNLLLLLFLNALVKPFWIFGIDRTVQNTVGADAYGFYFSLFSFSMLLNILLDAGITNYNNRTISRHPGRISEYFSLLLPIKVLLAMVYTVVSLSVALVIGYSHEQLHLLWFLILNQFLASLILYFRSNITGIHMFKTDSVLSVLDRFIMIILIGLALWSNVFHLEFNISWYVYLQSIAYGLTAITGYFLVRINTVFFRPRFDPLKTLRILKDTLPFALLTLLSALYYRVDSVMIERMLPDGKEQAGIYAQAFRILDAFTMYGYLFGVILLPLFSRMIKEKKPITELVRFAFLLLMVPVISLSIVSIIYRQPLMELLYHSHTDISSVIFAILMGAFIFVSGIYLFGVLLTAYGDLRTLNILAATGFVINIGLNGLLIPHFGAIGSAWASLVTTAGVTIGQIIFVSRRLEIPVLQMIPPKIFLFTALIIPAGLVCIRIPISFYASFGVVMGIAVVLAFLLRLFPLKQMISIMGSSEE